MVHSECCASVDAFEKKNGINTPIQQIFSYSILSTCIVHATRTILFFRNYYNHQIILVVCVWVCAVHMAHNCSRFWSGLVRIRHRILYMHFPKQGVLYGHRKRNCAVAFSSMCVCKGRQMVEQRFEGGENSAHAFFFLAGNTNPKVPPTKCDRRRTYDICPRIYSSFECWRRNVDGMQKIRNASARFWKITSWNSRVGDYGTVLDSAHHTVCSLWPLHKLNRSEVNFVTIVGCVKCLWISMNCYKQ